MEMSRSFAAYDLLDKFSVPYSEITESGLSTMDYAKAIENWVISVRYTNMHLFQFDI